MKPNLILHIVIASLCLSLFTTALTGCGDEPLVEEPSSSGRPLKEGEMSTVIFTNRVSSIEEITTRSIPKDKKTVLQDYANHVLKGADGGNAGWMSGEVRTEYGEEEQQAVTRTFESSKIFGKNSQFRMLVFKATSGGNVDMNKPIANVTCQVNSDGNGAIFLSPSSLSLLKGKYTFVCFPADEKYNTWAVGSTSGYQITIGKDNDFVCMRLADQEVNTTTTAIPLNKFERYGYQLTVKFSVNKNLGYVSLPTSYLDLDISDAGNSATEHVINTKATFDLKNKTISYTDVASEHTLSNSIQIQGDGDARTYASVSNFVIANNSASQKLTITYPYMEICKSAATPGNAVGAVDSIFQIKPGTYTTTEPVQFTAGKSYSITVAVGEQIKGIPVIFKHSTLDVKKIVIFSPSQLYYNSASNTWGWGKEQCDYGYVENNIDPGVSDMKLVNSPKSKISYYFMYGLPVGCIGTLTVGHYTGESTLFEVSLDPCQKMGRKWHSPTSEIIDMLSMDNESYKPVDEDGYFINNKSDTQWQQYTPTDNRKNKTPIPGRWVNCSPPAEGDTQHNSSRLFLPAGGSRHSGGSSMFSVGVTGSYWSSQSDGTGSAYIISLQNDRFYRTKLGRNNGFLVRCCRTE